MVEALNAATSAVSIFSMKVARMPLIWALVRAAACAVVNDTNCWVVKLANWALLNDAICLLPMPEN